MHLGCWRAPASAPGSGHLQGLQRGGGTDGRAGARKCSSTVKSAARPGERRRLGELEKLWDGDGGELDPCQGWFGSDVRRRAGGGGRAESSVLRLAVWRESSTFNCCCQSCDKRAPLIPSPSLTLSRVSALGLKCFHIPAPPLPTQPPGSTFWF